MNRRKVVLVAGVVVIGAALAALAWRSRKAASVVAAGELEGAPPAAPEAEAPAPPPTGAAAATTDARSAVAPEPPAPPVRPLAAPVPRRSEAALMTQLRDLSGSDPELSLRLAREGNRQFEGSADEPERCWYIVKSLMHLARADEARAEARVLLDKYPASDWAQDVHRHLFVNPPTHPLERGYGKTLELP